jgi:hypothetical protein
MKKLDKIDEQIRRSWRYTDFISDKQKLVCWGFDFRGLKSISETGNYSDPVRQAMFTACKDMAESGDRFIRNRHFTIFMGDYGPENEIFWIGIRWSTSKRIFDIFSTYLKLLKGFDHIEEFRTPWVPLVPMYRYEYGRVIEYIYEDTLAGMRSVDLDFGTGVKMLYRLWVSAEEYDLKQKYRG